VSVQTYKGEVAAAGSGNFLMPIQSDSFREQDFPEFDVQCWSHQRDENVQNGTVTFRRLP